MTLSVNNQTGASSIGGVYNRPITTDDLVEQNKAFVSESDKNQKAAEKKYEDAHAAFLKQRAKMLASSIGLSQTSRQDAQAANIALMEVAALGGGDAGAMSVSIPDEPTTSANTPSLLQGDVDNIRFTSGGDPRF